MSEALRPAQLNGRKVVLMLFGFGIVMVGSLWAFFELQTRSFRELTVALAAEFPESRPLVHGGQEKMHQGTPPFMRVLVTVTFDPLTENEQFQEVTQKVLELCEKHHDMEPYEMLEVNLVKRIPEQEPLSRKIEFDLKPQP